MATPWLSFFSAVAIAAVSGGCEAARHGADGRRSDEGGGESCSSGVVASCSCPDGSIGVQVCIEHGTTYGECICTEGERFEFTFNACEPEVPLDMTGEEDVTIAFGGELGHAYSPRCIRIRVGQSVTFSGRFSAHPLRAGRISGFDGTVTKDETSPIKRTDSGTERTFTFNESDSFGYFCDVHGKVPGGMNGAIFVTQ